jgi:hypothetical protein
VAGKAAPKASDETRAAAIALRVADPKTWSIPQIASALRMSVGWVAGILKTDVALEAIKRAEDEAAALPVPPVPPVDVPAETATAEGSVDVLRRTLAQLGVEIESTRDKQRKDQLRKQEAHVAERLLRSQLMVKRETPERDTDMLRAGHQADASFVHLLEEAIGESIDGSTCTTCGGLGKVAA